MKNLIILALLILTKSIFSASDEALLYLNRSKISQLAKRGNKKAKLLNELLKSRNKFFATIKISITLLEFAASGFAAETFLKHLCEKLKFLPLDNNVIYIISMIIITIILSYVSLIIGDLLPKRIAKNYPERTAMSVVYLVYFVSKLIYPFELVLNVSLKAICKIFHIKDEKQERLTEKELKMIISEGKDVGVIDAEEKILLLNALKFDDLCIKDILIQRDKVTFIDINTSYNAVLGVIRKYAYTRIPVYDRTIDNIVGILNVKDIICEYGKIRDKNKKIDIKKLIRPAFFVDKNDKVDDTFRIMQLNSKVMAIVLNSDNKVEGIVTISDMLSKLVGNIFDEFNHQENA
ncbi:MAG: hemolysin family protein [Clostridia bacterium]|nr:hemolysin family protein [Clostridia bacterium]